MGTHLKLLFCPSTPGLCKRSEHFVRPLFPLEYDFFEMRLVLKCISQSEQGPKVFYAKV